MGPFKPRYLRFSQVFWSHANKTLSSDGIAAICLICVLAQGEKLAEINLISSKVGTSWMKIWQIVISYSNKGGFRPEMRLHYFYLPHLSAKSQDSCVKRILPAWYEYLHTSWSPIFSNGYILLRNPLCERGHVIHKRLSELTWSDAC